MDNVKVTAIFGHVQIVPTHRWEGNTLISGGYAIHYDADGNETHRTEDTETSRMICQDAETKLQVSDWLNR